VRRPVWVLHVFVVGLALHNFVMAELWDAGVRGTALEVVSAWKDALLVVALALVFWQRRGALPTPKLVDFLALGYGLVVCVYALLPQGRLGGAASHHGVLLALRHDLVPVGAYFLGRGLALTGLEVVSVARTIVLTGLGIAAVGLVDVYAVPLSWWRRSGAPGWFSDQLGFAYKGLSGLPENFVYNTGNEHPLRRLVSVFLSPLATSYLLVVALLVCAAWWVRSRPSGLRLVAWLGSVALLFAGLLWTHTRSSYIALAAGLIVFAAVRGTAVEKVSLVLAAAAVVAVGAGFVRAFPHIGPSTTFTRAELQFQRRNAHSPAGVPAGSGVSDASTASHWRSLRSGIGTVVHHPQGYGLGNAGSTAARTGTQVKAGESTYTELGVETGVLGAVLFVAWSIVLLARALPCAAWVGASLLAVLALGLQTDVIGVPWLAYVLWALAASVQQPRNDPSPERLARPLRLYR
jgi:O-antigen ligase/polysaccharide polymerase Wzy-like membrane protein